MNSSSPLLTPSQLVEILLNCCDPFSALLNSCDIFSTFPPFLNSSHFFSTLLNSFQPVSPFLTSFHLFPTFPTSSHSLPTTSHLNPFFRIFSTVLTFHSSLTSQVLRILRLKSHPAAVPLQPNKSELPNAIASPLLSSTSVLSYFSTSGPARLKTSWQLLVFTFHNSEFPYDASCDAYINVHNIYNV